jgi:hypothetical protein
MSWRIDSDLVSGNSRATLRWDGTHWQGTIPVHGGADCPPADAKAKAIDRLASEVASAAKAAQTPKGRKADGIQLRQHILDLDAEISQLRLELGRGRRRLDAMATRRREAVLLPDDAEMTATLAQLDEERAALQATITAAEQAIAVKQQLRESLLARFRMDLGESIRLAVQAEARAAYEAQAAAWAAAQAALAPHLTQVASAVSRLEALQAQTITGTILAQVEALLLASAASVPTPATKQPQLATAG